MAAHDLAGRLASCYGNMRQHIPDLDRILIGQRAILDYLHTLQIRRPNGGTVTWRMVLRWHRTLLFPLVSGGWLQQSGARASPVTTSHAVASWICAQFSTAHNRNSFGVATAGRTIKVGKRPSKRDGHRALRDAA